MPPRTFRRWKLAALGLPLLVAACGPPEITQVVPPGVDPEAFAVVPEEEGFATRGEAAEIHGESVIEVTPNPPTPIGQEVTAESGVKYTTLHAGSGPQAKSGDRASVHYKGMLTSGSEFDNSYRRGEPLTFTIGGSRLELIPGWHQGVAGMQVGERRRVVIPPVLGYGQAGNPPVIKPNETLIFEMELVDLKQPSTTQ